MHLGKITCVKRHSAHVRCSLFFSVGIFVPAQRTFQRGFPDSSRRERRHQRKIAHTESRRTSRPRFQVSYPWPFKEGRTFYAKSDTLAVYDRVVSLTHCIISSSGGEIRRADLQQFRTALWVASIEIGVDAQTERSGCSPSSVMMILIVSFQAASTHTGVDGGRDSTHF